MKYFVVFGYETPAQLRENHANGWDDENSSAILVDAASEDEALAWGRQVAEQFVAWLYQHHGGPPSFSWLEGGYAISIERLPAGSWPKEGREIAPVVVVGEYPDFERLA